MPRCKHCREKFISKYFNQKYCLELECIKAFSQSVQDKHRKEKKAVMKEGLLTKSDYLKLLQTVFNSFVRARDALLPCISCQTKECEEFHAGHYIATTHSYLRFNENNVWKQCSKCNTHLRGNSIPYRIELIKKIGIKEVEKLEADRHKKLELTITEIKDLIKIYKAKLKELKTKN